MTSLRVICCIIMCTFVKEMFFLLTISLVTLFIILFNILFGIFSLFCSLLCLLFHLLFRFQVLFLFSCYLACYLVRFPACCVLRYWYVINIRDCRSICWQMGPTLIHDVLFWTTLTFSAVVKRALLVLGIGNDHLTLSRDCRYSWMDLYPFFQDLTHNSLQKAVVTRDNLRLKFREHYHLSGFINMM